MSLHEFKLPDVGEGLRDGEIVKWHVGVGDAVKAHQVIVDVQTDKAIVEIPAPVTGTVVGLGGEAGDVLAVGEILATFEAEGDTGSSVQISSPPATNEAVTPAPASGPTRKGKRALASPAVRKRALALGVDLAAVTGSGNRGQITRADVEAANNAPKSAPGDKTMKRQSVARPQNDDRVEPLRGLRRRIATTIEAAWREIPHIYSVLDIDATDLVRARASLAAEYAQEDTKLTYMPFFVKACVIALKTHPSFNASIDMQREEIIYRHRYNVGFATATPDGLVVPVVHNADELSLVELARRIGELADLTRNRRANVEQLSNGTFTVSNFGAYGHGVGMPIIRPPEVAIAGFGRIHDKVVAVNGQPIVRATLPLVVTTDHRLNDGAHLGAFVDTLATYLAEPIRLLGRD